MFLNFNYVLYVLNYVLNLRSKSTFCFVGYISLAWKKQLLFVLVTTPVLMEKALKFPCFFNAFFKKLHRLAWKILKHNAFCISIYTGLDGKSMDISLLFQCFFQKTTSVWMEISMLFLLITTSVSM